MKKLVIDSISDSAQMPIKKGTLQFLQDANYEAMQSIVLAAIGSTYDPTKVYVLYGCINSGSGNSYTITAGAVFYAGEIYLVDAASFTASGSNVGVFSIAITQYTNNADPVTFADTTIQNVHNIRKMLISAGASGSTIGDYSARSPFSFSLCMGALQQHFRIVGGVPSTTRICADPAELLQCIVANPAVWVVRLGHVTFRECGHVQHKDSGSNSCR